ncbi:MAG TPA: fibronectin type III domain-containing protein [Mariniphaga anaerophila]|uniref:Fibronectin type III domain-containing protein n=1 Tax=Mariniphaga anaerophila TaxID=1484053 RepID=A0A831PJ87_9BACT|nr:fibronectin type III domain-containing protein [Mariniphaga anaerophila]
MRTIQKGLIYAILILFVFQACKKEDTSPITCFTASQGNCIGVIRLAVEQVSNVENYTYERKNPQTNQWEQIYWGFENVYDDTGFGLSNNKLVPGQPYEYRVRAHTDKKGYGDYSSVVTGYMFSPAPRIDKIDYKAKDEDPGSYNIEYRIVDKLPVDIQNLRKRAFQVFRAESFDMTLNYSMVLDLSIQSNNLDSIFASTISTNSFDKNKTYYYKIEAIYEYWFNGIRENDFLEYTEGWYEYTSGVYEGGSLNGGDPNGEIGIVAYTISNFGEIAGSVSGAKASVTLRADGSNIYLGFLSNYLATSMGTPTIQKFNGTSWDNAMDIPSSLIDDSGIDAFDFTVSNNIIYLAARSYDSIYVYKHDGEWSQNLSTATLRGDGYRKYLNIEILNNELYATVMHDDDIKLFKLEGDDWTQIGDVIASGFYTNTKLKNIEGTLYLWYERHVSGSSQTTLYIRHLQGTSLINDFEWTKESAIIHDIVKSAGSLYFIDGHGKGGVYKVESANSATDLFENVGNLYGSPGSITTDASGNLIISCLATAQDPANMHMVLLVYDGSSWKKIDDNLSETSYHGKTDGVQAIDDNVYFVYGLKSSENALNIPTILKAKKYSK